MKPERMLTCGCCRCLLPDSLATMRPLKRRHKRDRYSRPVCPACEEMGWQEAEHVFSRLQSSGGKT